MINNGLNALPVIDDNGRAIDIFSFSNLSKSTKIKNPLVIMAGGIGSRLLPYTKHVQKANVTLTWRQTHP